MLKGLKGEDLAGLNEGYLRKRAWTEVQDGEEVATPSTVCAIDPSELNAVERAFFRVPRSPEFLIYTDK